MTTNTEQRQAIWYVSGLAEVLAGPGSQDQADDAIVQFDRYRQTRTPASVNASPNTLGHAARRRPDQWGYVVVDDVESLTAAEELVRSVGELIPQDDGLLTHEVTYRPENDDRFRELRTSVLIPDGSLLIWDNQRMLHARSEYRDRFRHLTRFWSSDWRRA